MFFFLLILQEIPNDNTVKKEEHGRTKTVSYFTADNRS